MTKPRQPRLPGTASRAKRGVVERAAGADLTALRREDVLPTGSEALQAAFRLLAREVDRADLEQDRYGKINATRELRNVRQALGSLDPTAGDAELDKLLASVSTALRNLETPG